MARQFGYPNNQFEHFKDVGGEIHGTVTATAFSGPVTGAVTASSLSLGSNVVFLVGAASPTDGTTGDNVAGPGSLYFATTAGELWIQTSLISTPVWVLVGDQTEA